MEFPVIHNEKEGRTNVRNTPCLNCGRALNDGEFPRIVHWSFSTILLAPDGTGAPVDEMESMITADLFDFSKDNGATLVLAKEIGGGGVDFCFCSVNCCRAWLNCVMDELERKAKLGKFL